MKIAIGGGHGFIGRELVRRLMAAGHQVAPFGRDGDPGDADALVWAAGHRSLDEQTARAVHVDAPAAALAAGGSLRRVVYLSSGEVYGEQAVPVGEDAPLLGRSAYARAKIAGEQRLRQAAAERGVALTVLRLAVVYGPGQDTSMFIPTIVTRLAARQRVALTGGAQTRDFLEVGDAAALIARALAAPPGVFNGGTGREVRLADAARTIAAGFGAWGEALLDLGALPYREGEIMRSALDPARAAERLGWRASVAFEEGVARLLATL